MLRNCPPEVKPKLKRIVELFIEINEIEPSSSDIRIDENFLFGDDEFSIRSYYWYREQYVDDILAWFSVSLLDEDEDSIISHLITERDERLRLQLESRNRMLAKEKQKIKDFQQQQLQRLVGLMSKGELELTPQHLEIVLDLYNKGE